MEESNGPPVEVKKKRGRPKKVADADSSSTTASSTDHGKKKRSKRESKKNLLQAQRLISETSSQYVPESLWLVQTPFVRRQLGDGESPLWYLEAPVYSKYSGHFLEPLLALELMPSKRAPWLELMCKVRYQRGRPSLAAYKRGSNVVAFSSDVNPSRKEKGMTLAFSLFQEWQLEQTNQLLRREFWPGINVDDHLKSPEFTAVVLYQKLLVGCVFSSPDGYITYFYIRPGWRACGIGKRLLYYLLTNAKSKSVTLHVSVNNNALLLYQEFGFKPEEFIVDFYDKYLTATSEQCKNAYYLRLRL